MRKQVQELKKSIIDEIKGTLQKHHFEEIYWSDIDEGCSPIIMEDHFDDNNTFTVDSVTKDGVWGSNCSENHFWKFDELFVEVLEEILNQLSDYVLRTIAQ